MITVKDLLIKHKVLFFEKGRNFLIKCLNPEHTDANPSMSVHQDTGQFRCFSCGEKGGFNKLCKLLGEEIEPDGVNAFSHKIQELKRKLLGTYSDQDKIQIDFPQRWSIRPGPFRGISEEILQEFNIFISNSEDFLGRVWMPVYHRGKLICFQGRADLPNVEPKYLFHPRHVNLKPVIFDITKVPSKAIILTEGLVDALRLRSAGVKEACCIFGSYFGIEKLYTLLAHDIEIVITMFDPDGSGRKCASETKRTIEKHAPHIACINVNIEGENDPGDLTYAEIYEYLGQKPIVNYLDTEEWL